MKHVFSKKEVGYDYNKGTKDYFCKRCQKRIAMQNSPDTDIIYLPGWDRPCLAKHKVQHGN